MQGNDIPWQRDDEPVAPVLRWETGSPCGIGAVASASACRPLHLQTVAAPAASPRCVFVLHLIKIAAFRTDKDIFRMTRICGHQISGKQINLSTAMNARRNLHPKKIFNMGVSCAAQGAFCSVKMADLGFKIKTQVPCGIGVTGKVQVFNLLFNNPKGHWIDVKTGDITAHPVCFQNGNAPSHEGVRNMETVKMMGPVINFFEMPLAKLGQNKSPKQGSGTSGKPFMNSNNRAVVLLNLFFTARQIRNKGDFKLLFDHRVVFSLLIFFKLSVRQLPR